MQGPAQAAIAALAVARCGFLQCIRVELDHRAQARPGAVQGRNALQVGLGQGGAVQLTGGHPRLQIGDIGFGVRERHVAARGFGRMRAGRGRAAASRKQRRQRGEQAAMALAQVAGEDVDHDQVDRQDRPRRPTRVPDDREDVEGQVQRGGQAAQPGGPGLGPPQSPGFDQVQQAVADHPRRGQVHRVGADHVQQRGQGAMVRIQAETPDQDHDAVPQRLRSEHFQPGGGQQRQHRLARFEQGDDVETRMPVRIRVVAALVHGVLAQPPREAFLRSPRRLR
ncbi:hypothetical protein G6F22_014724 [Rhizopus arrhizus]|nr:hypothetical protein G6F22_014724 [Rhizopus arrhizus]